MAVLLLVAVACSGGDEPERTPGAAARPATVLRPGWDRLPDPPLEPRTSAAAVWTGEEVVVVGGWRFRCPPGADCATPDDPPFTDGASYDPDRVPPAGGRTSSDGAITAVGRRLFTFGGQRWEGSDGELLREAWLWSPP